MQRDLKMRKRKRKDTDVAGSPQKKIQGGGNISHSADPRNNMQEDVSVRKRRAGDDGEMPGKRMRCSNLTNPTEHTEVSVEDRSIQRGKRKASVDARTSSKKMRCSINNTTDPSAVSEVNCLLRSGKRKASDDGEAPEKKIRCSNSASVSESSAAESNITVSSLEVKEDVSADDISHNFGSVSAEEEKIYEMSSSGNTSRGKQIVGKKMTDKSVKYC